MVFELTRAITPVRVVALTDTLSLPDFPAVGAVPIFGEPKSAQCMHASPHSLRSVKYPAGPVTRASDKGVTWKGRER